jgi:hypothetical protein
MYEGREKVEGRAESIRDSGNGKVSEKWDKNINVFKYLPTHPYYLYTSPSLLHCLLRLRNFYSQRKRESGFGGEVGPNAPIVFKTTVAGVNFPGRYTENTTSRRMRPVSI